MLSIALTTFALTVRDTPTATPALRLRGGGKLHASNRDTSRHTRRIAHRFHLFITNKNALARSRPTRFAAS